MLSTSEAFSLSSLSFLVQTCIISPCPENEHTDASQTGADDMLSLPSSRTMDPAPFSRNGSSLSFLSNFALAIMV